ncbi:MAG: Na(+)-translocating NADH-quinone reductase subunit C [Bacteroidota bacterium]
MPNDSIKKTIQVAVGVCLVASILVSTAAVKLKPIQEKNKQIDLLTNILVAGNLYVEDEDPQEIFNEKIETKIVDLESGKFINADQYNEELNPKSFNINDLANSDEYGKEIPSEIDKAGIKRQPKFMIVYIVQNEEGVEKYILPLYGKGLWSTMYGFMALNKNLHTIDGFTFYQHGETPGLGGEVDNPRWKAQWKGKQAFDENWEIAIQVIKGMVDPDGPSANSQIDGLSGSTLTTRGVDNLVNYWLGEQGYGPFFENLREGL